MNTPRDPCLDAETLAAWFDAGLSGAELEMAQAHVADCARCQSLVGAMARTHVAVVPPARDARRWLGWLVPLAAAAAAVTLWVAVPREGSVSAPPAAPSTSAREDAPESNAPVPQSALDKADRRAPAPGPAVELRKDAGRLEADARQELAETAPAAAAPAGAQAAAARARSANAVADICGAGWDAMPTGLSSDLTAGAAPSPSVCWVVGRDGVVLLSVDGRTWRRVAFPDVTDLSAVQATDARTASVTTSGGLIFTTSDGGVTWGRR